MATDSTLPGYVRLKDAAEIIGVSHSQVWRYIDAGLIEAKKFGNTHLVKKQDAENFQRPPRGNPGFLARKTG